MAEPLNREPAAAIPPLGYQIAAASHILLVTTVIAQDAVTYRVREVWKRPGRSFTAGDPLRLDTAMHELLGYRPRADGDVVVFLAAQNVPVEMLPVVDGRITYAPHDRSVRETLTVGQLRKRAGGGRTVAPILAVVIVVAIGVTLVALTLRPQPAVPTYTPTVPAPSDAGRALVGPVLYTVDATAPDAWRHFSFRLGSIVDGGGDWDLAFRRYAVIAGRGGVLDLGEVRFDDVRVVPDRGYQLNEGHGEPRNPAIAGWYRYGFFSHVLSPKPHVWAVRTGDGRYAKIEMVGYYCAGGHPGCPTFRYVYQGDGSTVVASR